MAGYIASEFERFTATCLDGQQPEQIANARIFYYAGVLGAVHAINKTLRSDDPTAFLTKMESILDECAVFKTELASKLGTETKGKK